MISKDSISYHQLLILSTSFLSFVLSASVSPNESYIKLGIIGFICLVYYVSLEAYIDVKYNIKGE